MDTPTLFLVGLTAVALVLAGLLSTKRERFTPNTPPATKPVDTGIDTPLEPRTEFDVAVELYRKYMLAYKTNGDITNKNLADKAKKWLDDYLKTMGKNLETDSEYIQQFVDNYKQSNPELIELQQKIKKVREEGPKLQDTYETEKKATYVEPYDVQNFYTKVGILGGVIAIVLVVAFA